MKRSLTKSKIPGYDTIRNDRSTGQKGGVAFLVKHGLVINKEYRNSDFSIITENEALAINLDLSNNQNVTLVTIYCPNGNPNLSLFQTINNLSDNVMFVGDFNSKLESFGCAHRNPSGPMLKNIQKQLSFIYLNSDERTHTHMDRAKGSTDILDMAFISPNLAKHDLQFQIGDDLGSVTYPRKFHTAVDKAIPTSKSVRPESNPISNETLALIKEKRRLRRQYSQKKEQAEKRALMSCRNKLAGKNSATPLAQRTTPMILRAKLRTSLSRRVSVTIQLCITRTESPRPTPIKRNSLPNLLRDISA